MQLSREEFMAQMQAQADKRQVASTQPRSRVGFFGLKDDGDEAIVRFAVDPEEFQIFTVHPVTIDGKFRKVNCINDIKTGVHSCPLCEAGVQLQNKFYIRLIEYTRDDQGNIVAEAKVWERPTSYVQRLMNLYTEYGSLKDVIFKVKRNGAKGDMKTDYVMMFCNPSIYNEQLYTKDFSAFEGYSPLGSAILNKTPEEMVEYLPKEHGATFTPQTAMPVNNIQQAAPQMNTTAAPPAPQMQATWTSADSLNTPRRTQVMYQ